MNVTGVIIETSSGMSLRICRMSTGGVFGVPDAKPLRLFVLKERVGGSIGGWRSAALAENQGDEGLNPLRDLLANRDREQALDQVRMQPIVPLEVAADGD
jgi:hypothetical protein